MNMLAEELPEDRINKIILTNDVQSAIEQVLQSSDPLDHPDFNCTDYINQLFPNEQSLSNIDDVIGRMECEISVMDDNIRSVVRGQSNTGENGRIALEEAQKTINQLFSQITEIKTRAERTEDMVKEITRDIKQLDCAKRNLTSAITTLNHLHMLVGGVDSLTKLVEKRFYGEILNPLQAITEVNQHFSQYTEIPQIKSLAQRVAEIEATLATQITEDFKNFFTPGSSGQKMSISQLTDACKVLSVLDTRVKKELLKWFINLQLQEYQQLFQENQDIAWLDKIDKRYAWLKRHLLDFENKYGQIFPLEWELSERITVQFCNITRDELGKLLQKRLHEVDVKLLLYAIQKTMNFEQLLGKRFTGVTLSETIRNAVAAGGQQLINNNAAANVLAIESEDEDVRRSMDNLKSDEEGANLSAVTIKSPFTDLIGACFKPHLDIYTDSIDRNLSELIERFVQQSAAAPSNPSLSSTPAPLEIKSTVFPTCADLFVFYKKCLVQCTQLSNGKPMYDLALIFKKYLREYALRLLEAKIPKLQTTTSLMTSAASQLHQHHVGSTGMGAGGGGSTMSSLTKDLQNLSTAAGQVFHSLLKEGDNTVRLTRDELIRICSILTTAEYCLETVQQLEDKLKEKINVIFVDRIDLSDEKDLCHRIISNCIQLLVQDLENGCDSALSVMSKIQWHSIQNVGDQSPFVNTIISNFKQTIPVLRDNLATSRKYYTQFCHKFVNTFIPKYINNLYKCRPTVGGSSGSDGGAAAAAAAAANSGQASVTSGGSSNNILGCEQLLLDTHSLKTVLLDLPSIGSQVIRKAPASYTKVVVKGMTKAEMVIKVCMASTYPAPTFIDQYLKLLPESQLTEFHRILDMKGVRRAEQHQLLEMFKRQAPKENLQTGDGSALGSTVASVTDFSPDMDKGRIKKLENLIKKRLPN